jgi:hypothetical protein
MHPMQPKHSKQDPKPLEVAGTDPVAVATVDLGSALVEFARRLANFGLGEAETPLLDELIDRRRHPRLQA